MFHRCYECPALQTERDMYVSQEVRVAARAMGSQHREQFAHGIFPDPGAILPTGFPERQAPRWAAGGAHFHGRLFVGQRSAASSGLGCGGGRRCREPQGGSVWSGAERRSARASRSRWRRLCSGGAVGSAHALYRLRIYHRENQRSKAKSPHTSGTGFWFPTTRSGRSRSRVMRQSATWRRGEPMQEGKRFCRHLRKERGRHTQTRFSRCQYSRWPSKRHDSGPEAGTTPGLLRQDHGYGRRERD